MEKKIKDIEKNLAEIKIMFDNLHEPLDFKQQEEIKEIKKNIENISIYLEKLINNK